MNSDQLERLVVVELEIETLKKTNEAILTELKSLNETVSKYKGFLGGIIFVLSSLWLILGFFKDQIFGLFSK